VSDPTSVDKILAAVWAIPRGSAASYGEVARRAGLPGRARLVARVLAQNPDPKLPWHRVLRSDGQIALPVGSEAHAEQLRRLRAEGVEPGPALRRSWKSGTLDLDAAIWG